MPYFFGKEGAQKDLLLNLANEFKEIEREHKIPLSDFPEIARMQEQLKPLDFSNFPKFSERLMQQLDTVLGTDLPQIMKLVSPLKAEITNPFLEERWIIDDSTFHDFMQLFESLNPANGFISGNVAHDFFSNRGLGIETLRRIWDLVDFEKAGRLDCEEFALAVWLTERAKAGENPPDQLSPQMIPPSKRKQFGRRSQNQ